MKLAIIGTGKIVEEVLPILAKTTGIDLVAIVSTPRSIAQAEEIAEKYGFSQASSDYQAVLANPYVDTVYVASPNHLHYYHSKEALLAGKHVICEKPFTMTLEEFEDLVTLAEQRQLLILEAITNQYLNNFAYMKAKLPELGDIKIVECNYSQYSSRYAAFKRGEIAPAFDPKKGGGALRDLNIYNIHLVVGLFGRPKWVRYLANMERGVDTSGLLIMDYGDFKAVCIGAKDCSAEIRSTIQGNQGWISILGPTNSLPELSVALNGQASETVNENHHQHRMEAEFEAFEKIIADRDFTKARAALQHSRSVMAVLEEAVSSMA